MIRQQVGDLLEIHFDGTYSYVVVLTKIVMFGGNILFAYHTDGRKYNLEELLAHQAGFNVCADLLLPKREGDVTRIHHFEDVRPFWRTRFVKGTNEYRLGVTHHLTETLTAGVSCLVRVTSWIVPFAQTNTDDPRNHTNQHEPKYFRLERDVT